MRVHILSFASLLAVLLTGCGGGDSTGPKGDGAEARLGVLSFDYNGPLSGTFSASGAPKQTLEESLETGSFAVATRIPGNGMGVTAFRRTSGTRGDMIVVVIEGEETGGYDAETTTCGSRCATVLIYFDVDYKQGQQSYARAFAFETGSIEVEEATSSQLEGKFSGEAMEFLGDGGGLAVTNGRFSAPVMTAPPAISSAGMMAPLAMPGVGMMTAPVAIPDFEVSPPSVLARLDPTEVEGFDLLSAAGRERLLAFVGPDAGAR